MTRLKLVVSGVMLCFLSAHSLTAQASRQNYYSTTPSSNSYNTIESDLESDKDSFLPRFTGYIKKGVASWYGPGFHGKKTANGEKFNMYAMTAAHKTLPLSSYAEITNLVNHRSVIVRINDRGPFHGNRILDLSYAAAKKLGIQSQGAGSVVIKAIGSPHRAATTPAHTEQVAAAASEQNIYVKVGSFPSQKTAMAMRHTLTQQNLPTSSITQSSYKKSIFYTVQIGPIKSEQHADQIADKLSRIGIKNTQFIAEAKQM
ncbi:septal ring lytic transglycosylase RlpA family protein [Crenothrix polyspora]|uniref:Endolytic peptidoglycan transglycosylase RlpA n=1 Tax=Crenothrix polyspora TaxID=360316 RepID=A0A1R4H771_9GAMM